MELGIDGLGPAAAARGRPAVTRRCARSSSRPRASSRCRTSTAPTAGAGPGRGRRRAGRRVRHRRRVLHRRDAVPAPTVTRASRCGSGTSGRAPWRASATGSTRAGSGRRVTGDTMLGCGRCRRCRHGHQHVCAGPVRGRHPRRLRRRARRAARRPGHRRCTRCRTAWTPRPARWSSRAATRCGACAVPSCEPGDRAARARSRHDRPAGRPVRPGPRCRGAPDGSLGRARWSSPAASASTASGRTQTLPDLPFDAVVDASNAPALPARALDLVEPAGRVVYIGLAGSPSLIDTRALALGDVTAVGVLSASPGLRRHHRAVRLRRRRPAPAGRGHRRARRGGRRPRRVSARPAPAPDPRSTSTPGADHRPPLAARTLT